MSGKAGRNTLAFALHAAISAVRKFSIGRIKLGSLSWREGDFVLVDDSGDSLVVSSPLTPVEIEWQRAKGSLLVDVCTTIGVPRSHVEIVLSAEEVGELKGGVK